MAPNRPTTLAASRASASWSPSASASASSSRNSAQRLAVVANHAVRSRRSARCRAPSPTSRGKKRSKSASKVGRWLCFLTSVAAYAACTRLAVAPRRASRAPRPRRGPRPARPAARPRAAPRRRRCAGRAARCSCQPPRLAQPQLADRALLVGGVLEHDAERVVDGLVVEVADLERDQRARPVDGLGDRRGLLQLELAQPRDGRRPAGRPPAPRGRAPGTARSRARAPRRGSRGAGRGSAV